MKKLQDLYILNSGLSNKKVKGGSYADNGRHIMSYEKPEVKQDQEPEMDMEYEHEKDGVVKEEASSRSGRQDRPVTRKVDFTEPASKSIGKNKS